MKKYKMPNKNHTITIVYYMGCIGKDMFCHDAIATDLINTAHPIKYTDSIDVWSCSDYITNCCKLMWSINPYCSK